MYFESKETTITSASGSATATFSQCFGLLYEVIVIPGTATVQPDNNFDITIASQAGHGTQTLYTNTALSNTANTFAFPRAQVIKLDSTAVTSASNENVEAPVVGDITITGANLGATGKQVTIILIFMR
jgi:hypothetical protein